MEWAPERLTMPDDLPQPPSGHRALPHTADVILEAWAPSREACIAEAVTGLVDTFVDVSQSRATATHVFRIPVSTDPAALVSVLEEALYVLDMNGQVPIATSISDTDEGVMEGSFTLVDAGDSELKGSVPKGISLSGLEFTSEAGRWHCRVTVDV
jgi:SHS2 domain-containing protein